MLRRRAAALGDSHGMPEEQPYIDGPPGGAKKARPDDSCVTGFFDNIISHQRPPDGPSQGVMSLLRTIGCSTSQQLLSAVTAGAGEFAAAAATGAEAAIRDVQGRLQEMHSCIVALDDKLEEQYTKPAAGDIADLKVCRQWLKQTQGYVLQLQKQVAAFSCDGHSTSSMDDASSTSSNSTTAGTTGDAAWRMLCQESADSLASVGQCMAAGGSLVLQGVEELLTHAAVASERSSRLVAGKSCLSYSHFWSKKIAL